MAVCYSEKPKLSDLIILRFFEH